MKTSGGRSGGRQSRKELFSAEDLSLQWREMRKAVGAAAVPPPAGPAPANRLVYWCSAWKQPACIDV